jgi:hypothetical protein
MDSRSIPKLAHQIRKSLWRGVARKHGVVNQGQRLGAEIKKIMDLTGAVLESDDLSGTIRRSPKIRSMFQSKFDEDI